MGVSLVLFRAWSAKVLTALAAEIGNASVSCLPHHPC